MTSGTMSVTSTNQSGGNPHKTTSTPLSKVNIKDEYENQVRPQKISGRFHLMNVSKLRGRGPRIRRVICVT